jgi:hypothetical protein
LYHKLEAELDQALYCELKKVLEAELHPQPVVASNVQVATNNINPFAFNHTQTHTNLMAQGPVFGLPLRPASGNVSSNTPSLNNIWGNNTSGSFNEGFIQANDILPYRNISGMDGKKPSKRVKR